MVHWFQGVKYRLPLFLSNVKPEKLQITVLKHSNDFSKTVYFKRKFSLLLNIFLNIFRMLKILWLVIHFSFIFAYNKTEAIADHSFEMIT